MYQITINIGTQFRGDGLPLTDNERAAGRREVERMYLETRGGFTRYQVSGGWRDTVGQTHEENGLQYEVVADIDEEQAHKTGRMLALAAQSAFKQDTILLRVLPIVAEFVQ